ncbi:MAG: hypothetical protein US20_C0023G0008 [Candidatus Pacebacteria bacterium GW2011_GWF1_36_5]|nr:MAG: hypothetical protein US20_C0023G0008 [Candidatus Pacebacteria bacterium GW2011_GWF1_36_5]
MADIGEMAKLLNDNGYNVSLLIPIETGYKNGKDPVYFMRCHNGNKIFEINITEKIEERE